MKVNDNKPLVMTSQNLQNQKRDTLRNKSTDTALTPSEINLLRQDLAEAIEYAKKHMKKRNLVLT